MAVEPVWRIHPVADDYGIFACKCSGDGFFIAGEKYVKLLTCDKLVVARIKAVFISLFGFFLCDAKSIYE